MEKIKKHPFPLLGSYLLSINVNKSEALQSIEKQTNKHKFESLYIYRSFLCSQVLIDEYNWVQITMSTPQFISEFFNCLSQSLQQKYPKINIFIVIDLIKLFLQRDPKQTLLSFIHYNVPFILLGNIEHPDVRQFTLNFINLPVNHYKLEQEWLLILSKYFRYSNFFIDFINLLINKEYQCDLRKINAFYKLEELKEIYELSNNMLLQLLTKATIARKLPGICAIKLEKKGKQKIQTQSDNHFAQLVEEKLALTSDIDGILKYANLRGPGEKVEFNNLKRNSSKRDIILNGSIQEGLTNTQKQNSHRTLSRSQKMYPSLMESLREEEEAKIKEKAQLAALSKDLRRTRNSLNRSKISLSQPRSIRELSNESLSISRDTSQYFGQTDRKHIKTSGYDDGSTIYPFLFSEYINKETKEPRNLSRIRNFTKKSKESTSLQFNNLLLKMIHPEVKQHIYITHFQRIKAPLTQSILGPHALPSKSLGRSLSLPSLSKLKKDIKAPDELTILSLERPFTPNTAKNNEDLAYPMALALNDLIFAYFENYKPTNLMMKIGIHSTAYLKMIQCIQGKEGGKFFSLLLIVSFY